MRCSHCFYINDINQHKDMQLEEIERVAASIKSLPFLRVTGGEPFLRKDLPEALHAFYKLSNTRRMGIITNGSRPEWVEKAIDQLFTLCPGLVVDIGVSIDGLKEAHDAIRCLDGAFDNAYRTVETLLECKKRHPNLLTSIVMTVTAANQDELDALYDETASWGVDRLSVNHVRGETCDQSLLNVAEDKYREFALKCERYHLDRDRSWKAGVQRAKNRLTRKAIEQIDKRGKSDIPCLAGSAIGVMYSDGDVYLCEMLDKELSSASGVINPHPYLGNVIKAHSDFYKLWHSENAKRCREWIIETNCSCTHECFLTASILFGKSNYPRLAWEWVKQGIGGKK